jgi:hypothetical protein
VGFFTLRRYVMNALINSLYAETREEVGYLAANQYWIEGPWGPYDEPAGYQTEAEGRKALRSFREDGPWTLMGPQGPIEEINIVVDEDAVFDEIDSMYNALHDGRTVRHWMDYKTSTLFGG